MNVPAITNRAEVAEFIRFCAWQERAVSRIGRTTKADRAAHEHAAKTLETVAQLFIEAAPSPSPAEIRAIMGAPNTAVEDAQEDAQADLLRTIANR